MMTLDALARDIRLAVRLLVRSPGFTLAAALTLALGIGANTAIFSVAWQAILKPLPYPSSDRLVNVWETFQPGDRPNPVMPGNFHDWQREARSFDAIAAYTYFQGATTMTGTGEPEQLRMRYVTGDYFRVFGMAPLLGRPLDDHDINDDSTAVVIGEFLWRDRFGRDPTVVGREVRLGDKPHVIVGVMPSAFSVAGGRVDAWVGLQVEPEQPGKRLRAHYLGVVARLKPAITLPQAVQDVKAIAARAATLYPEANGELSATVTSIAAEHGSTLRAGLAILAWAAGFVLLIACANLASLQLARGVSREREFGIRAALGAARGRLVTQLLAESVTLSVLGGVAGLLLGSWLLHAIAALAPATVKGADAAGVDTVIVMYASVLALLAACLAAAAPAWRAATRATRGFGQRLDTGDRRITFLRTALVTGQVALAIMLLVGATLLVTSLARVLSVDPGFDPTGVIAFDVSLPNAKYGPYPKQEQFFLDLMRTLRAVPGVSSVCAINEIPFDAQGGMTYVPERQTRLIGASPRNVTSACFDTLRMPIVRGRPFTSHETQRVGIVTESFARAAWPGDDPIGKRVHVGLPDGPLVDVVGVVADSLQVSLEGRPYPQFYEVMSEVSFFSPHRVLLRAGLPLGSLASAIRHAVRQVDPDQPVANLREMRDVIGASLSARSFNLSLIAAFSVVALVLAAIGIYGLLAQVVAQRTGEIGIRLALGATRASAIRLVMRNAWLAVACAVPIGIGGAVGASRLLRAFVFHVSPTDPTIYAGSAAALTVVVLASAWLAARRAARIDPVEALRR